MPLGKNATGNFLEMPKTIAAQRKKPAQGGRKTSLSDTCENIRGDGIYGA